MSIRCPWLIRGMLTICAALLSGKNLADENEDAWYFEFADSYARSAAHQLNYGDERRMTIAGARDLSEMLDLEGLIRELYAAADRRQPALPR